MKNNKVFVDKKEIDNHRRNAYGVDAPHVPNNDAEQALPNIVFGANTERNAKGDNNNDTHNILRFRRDSLYPPKETSRQGQKERRESAVSLGVGSIHIDSNACCYWNPSTVAGRRTQLFRLLFISLLPVVVLIVQNSITLYAIAGEVNRHQVMKNNIIVSVEIGVLVHNLQIERGTTALFTSSAGDETIGKKLRSFYNNTDLAIEAISLWPKLPNKPSHFKTSRSLHDYISAHRSTLDPTNATSSTEINFYTAIIGQIIDWMADAVQHAKSGDLWRTLVAYHLLIIAKEQAGIERALGSTFFARGTFRFGPCRRISAVNEIPQRVKICLHTCIRIVS
jgi:hypothetical protein